ncbi:MAG TPA: hypothetical protein VGO03_06570 [Acidimicrobiia bacterium]|jgi:hypothetical protein
MAALVGGVLCLFVFKLYLYAHDRAQYDDSNLLVSAAFVLIAATFIFLVLEVGRSVRSSSK